MSAFVWFSHMGHKPHPLEDWFVCFSGLYSLVLRNHGCVRPKGFGVFRYGTDLGNTPQWEGIGEIIGVFHHILPNPSRSHILHRIRDNLVSVFVVYFPYV